MKRLLSLLLTAAILASTLTFANVASADSPRQIPRPLGDVTGSGERDVKDAIQILRHLLELPSVLDSGAGTDTWSAALVTIESRLANRPRVQDAIEILRSMLDLYSVFRTHHGHAFEITRLLNHERLNRGRSMLYVSDNSLWEAALFRSGEIAVHFDADNRPNGQPWWTVLDGLKVRYIDASNVILGGARDAHEAVDFIMNDAELRDTVMHSRYSHIAVGSFRADNEVFFAILLANIYVPPPTVVAPWEITDGALNSIGNHRSYAGLPTFGRDDFLRNAAETRAAEIADGSPVDTRPDGRCWRTTITMVTPWARTEFMFFTAKESASEWTRTMPLDHILDPALTVMEVITIRREDTFYTVIIFGEEPEYEWGVELSASSHTFESREPGFSAAPTLRLDVTNSGNMRLDRIRVFLEGEDALAFEIRGSSQAANVNPGNSTSVVVAPLTRLPSRTYTATIRVEVSVGDVVESLFVPISFTVLEPPRPDCCRICSVCGNAVCSVPNCSWLGFVVNPCSCGPFRPPCCNTCIVCRGEICLRPDCPWPDPPCSCEPPESFDTVAFLNEAVQRFNEMRVNGGVPAMSTDARITAAAMARALEIADGSHPATRPDGSSWDTLLDEFSIPDLVFGNTYLFTDVDSPQQLVNYIAFDEYECPSITHVGIGAVFRDEVLYIVVMFLMEEEDDTVSLPEFFPLPDRRLTVDEREVWESIYHSLGGASETELEIVRLTNEIRSEHGLSPLAVNDTLMMVARFHAQTMAAFGTQDDWSHHVGPYGGPHNRGGEGGALAAFGFGGSTGGNAYAGRLSAEALVSGWMNSEGHRANILSTRYTQIGVGRAVGGSWGAMTYQLFH
jgi:uncharacterized protein YkwD